MRNILSNCIVLLPLLLLSIVSVGQSETDQPEKKRHTISQYLYPAHLGPVAPASILNPVRTRFHLSPTLIDRLGLYHIPPTIKFQRVPSNDMKVYIKMKQDTLGYELEGLEGLEVKGRGNFSFRITGDGALVLDLLEGQVSKVEFLDYVVYNDSIDSDSITIRFDNGDRFVGKLVEGRIHGSGKAYFHSGDTYTGDFEYGTITGEGQFNYLDGDTYIGDVLEGLPHGQGTILFANGDTYEGTLEVGKMHGTGTYHYRNGRKYIGSFRSDEMEGKGTILYANGNRYTGYLKEGVKHGPGKFYRQDRLVYEGDYLNDQRHGEGLLFFDNEDSYNGEFSNGKMNGKGVLLFHNGDRYEGEFLDGKMHGKGTYFFEDGKRFEGKYANGRRLGDGVLYFVNGDYFMAYFEGQYPEGEGYYFKKKKNKDEYNVKVHIYDRGQLLKIKKAKSIPSMLPDHTYPLNKPSS